MTELDDIIRKMKALRNPALQADAIAGFVRGLLDAIRDRGVPVTAMVHTFEEAGLASAGEGVLVSDPSVNLELRVTLGPDFTVDIHVQATTVTETNEHLARMLQAGFTFAVRLTGL